VADDPGVENESQITQRRAGSFGAIAELYDRVRPGYPPEAISWLLPEDPHLVADMGAGTGALTRSMLALGIKVTAVEPDDRMREVLSARSPGAEVLRGRAESLPFEDGALDAVLGAQMWHWVDAEAATAEVARVLRPGGVIGLLWNLRDESVPWMAELGSLMGGHDAHSGPARVALPAGALFSDAASADFPFKQQLATSELVDFVASRSHVQVMEPAERSELLERVRAFSESREDLARSESIEVPYITSCWRAVRL
jgi:SAM-dependent methyltransferase